jgi:prepilin-type N-terminal cleavage/methylation domain-containing protein
MRIMPNQGFTLIEMVMVIIILGIIIGMSSSLLTQGLDTFSTGENIVNANWQGQIAMERMSRDILLVRSPAAITTIAANNFAFTDMSNNTVSYSLSGTSLTLTQNGNSEVLANGILSLTFSYFDRNGTSTATATLVRQIRISINVTQNNANYTLTTAIYPRNLP